MNPQHRSTGQLTLGFLTLGAMAAPQDVLQAAALAGFGAAGLRISGRKPGDAWPSVDARPRAFEELAGQARALGVRPSSISGFYMAAQTEMPHLLANVEAARRIGAPLISQGCFEPDRARLRAMLRDYGQAAHEAGLRIALEFMPMSDLKTLPETLELIAHCGLDNIGLLIDTLHLARSGGTAQDSAATDPQRIYLTQICDAPAQLASGSTLYDEAMTGRLYPGDGQLDLAGYLRALPADSEIECETPAVADAALPLAERAARSAAKAEAFFSRHFPT